MPLRTCPAFYDMIEDSDRIRVFPKQVRASAGNMRDVTPVMDYPITFPLATRGAAATMQFITSIVSKESGIHVEPLNLPFLITDTISMGASGESARNIVKQIGHGECCLVVSVPLHADGAYLLSEPGKCVFARSAACRPGLASASTPRQRLPPRIPRGLRSSPE